MATIRDRFPPLGVTYGMDERAQQQAAARAMLAALKGLAFITASHANGFGKKVDMMKTHQVVRSKALAAIAAAEAAGITGEE